MGIQKWCSRIEGMGQFSGPAPDKPFAWTVVRTDGDIGLAPRDVGEVIIDDKLQRQVFGEN